jgi:hypothetical protein
MDLKFLKSLFFIYINERFSFYDKLIITAHWSFIDSDYVVMAKNEMATN